MSTKAAIAVFLFGYVILLVAVRIIILAAIYKMGGSKQYADRRSLQVIGVLSGLGGTFLFYFTYY